MARKYKVCDFDFVRTAKFAPEQYSVYDGRGGRLGTLELKAGIMTLVIDTRQVYMACTWDVPDINCFHTNERRERWMTEAALRLREVLNERK